MIYILRVKLLILFFTAISFMSFAYHENMAYVSTIQVAKDTEQKDTIVRLTPDRTSLIKNPLTGWAIYSDAYQPDMQFWEKFDALDIQDYATHLYIRWPWSAFEGEQGVYAWDHDPFFQLLTNGAKERGLKLAFRIYVDSRDYSTSSTPDYVQRAGAKGFIGNTKQWSPYVDDPVFQRCYEEFLAAFARRFDRASEVDFIDGFGFGKWGEGHSMKLADENNYDRMFKWVVGLYNKQFKQILVALNYHSEIGKPLLDTAFQQYDYILRHDAFGMGYYYQDFERQMAKAYFPQRPIIAESGWWQNGTDAWQRDDPANYKTWREVWEQTLVDALEARANTLDLRNIAETTSWLTTSPDLVQQFIEEGGYRLYPAWISAPSELQKNGSFQIRHEWHNLGVGVCPNNLRQWNHKYKVAFALLHGEKDEVLASWVDTQADPAEWLKDIPKMYTFTGELPTHVERGTYQLAFAVVDTSQRNSPALNLAIKDREQINGWWVLNPITIK